MYCQKCGENNISEAKFCRNCGAMLVPAKQSPEISPAKTSGKGNKGGNKWILILIAAIIIVLLFILLTPGNSGSDKVSIPGNGSETGAYNTSNPAADTVALDSTAAAY